MFDEKFHELYDQAYNTAMDKTILDDDNDESWDNERKMERKFSLALDTEVKHSSTNIIKDISEMITEALNEEVNHRFEPFKKDMVEKLRGWNVKWRKWAYDKLDIIEKKFERIGWDDETHQSSIM